MSANNTLVEDIDTGYVPHIFQESIISQLVRFNVLVCHRRFGKTVAAINILIDSCISFPRSDGKFAYLAPYMNQAKSIAWDYVKLYTYKIPNMKYSEQTCTAIFPNGVKLRLYGADNAESLRGGYFDGVVLDEVADMRPNVWGEILRPALADRFGWAIFIGTPKGINMFSELYFAALDNPDWYAEMFRASETELVSDAELADARSVMSDAQYHQEFECDFNASTDNTLIPISKVLAATKKALTRDDVKGSAKTMGIDVARYGDDRCCIFARQGLIAFKPKVYTKINNMEFAAICAESIIKFKPDAVFIDAGRGEGVIDRLRQLGHSNIIEVNFGGTPANSHYVNKRAEMWDTMSNWLDKGGMIPDNKDLKTDLCVPTYTYANASNKFALESKDSIKARGMKSPDLGDGLALTFAHPVGAKDSVAHTGVGMGHTTRMNVGGRGMSYNPIAEEFD